MELLTSPKPLTPEVARTATVFKDALALMKARLSALVVVTAGIGYLLAAGGDPSLVVLAAATLGTFFLAGGAAALNHRIEHARDARMDRTRDRPIPSGRVSPGAATAFGLLLIATGAAVLLFFTTPSAAAIGVACAGIYVGLYTPLKPVSTLNTLVGAIVGAMPPLIGWAAAGHGLALGAWLLAAILFLWQIPHFLSLAWLYREDYRRGGFRMLPGADEDGRGTARTVLLYTLALVPTTLAAASIRPSGWLYIAGAALLGAGLLALGARFFAARTAGNARRFFFATLFYLPLLFLLMAFDPTGVAGRSW